MRNNTVLVMIIVLDKKTKTNMILSYKTRLEINFCGLIKLIY